MQYLQRKVITFSSEIARKGTNHVALKINILQQFARWRFCAYRAGVYAPFAGWIRRSHHPAAICRLVRVVVRVAAVVHQRAAGVNVAEDIHVARNHRAVSDAAAACHTAKP